MNKGVHFSRRAMNDLKRLCSLFYDSKYQAFCSLILSNIYTLSNGFYSVHCEAFLKFNLLITFQISIITLGTWKKYIMRQTYSKSSYFIDYRGSHRVRSIYF